MNEAIEKELLKFRKGSSIKENFKTYKAVLESVGFSLEKVNSFAATELSYDELKTIRGTDYEIHTNTKYSRLDTDNNKQTVTVYCKYLCKVEKARKNVLDLVEDKSKPKRNTKYYSNVTEISEDVFFESTVYKFEFDVEFYGACLVATDKEGNSKEFKTGDKRLDFMSVYRWLKKETNFLECVLDTLGLEDYETERANKRRVERTRENTGTCGVCGCEHKLDAAGRLVNHGFTRPGHGYIVGNCFGVGYEPFELSSKAVDDYIEVLTKTLSRYELYVSKLKNGEIKEIKAFVYNRKERKKVIKHFDLGDEGFDDVLKAEIVEYSRNVEFIKRDIDIYTEKSNNWKLDILPWEKLNKK